MFNLARLWTTLHASLWFIPTVSILFSILLAILLIELDDHLGSEFLQDQWRLFGAGADGSRELMGAIANSMIAVASVTFSITILVLSQAAAQYSPRTLRTFLKSYKSQLSMGVFVSIFVYSLIVLRSIESGEEEKFIPVIAISVGLLLGMLSVAVLVFFIHHIAHSIQASQVIADVSDETIETIRSLYPQKKGEVERPPLSVPERKPAASLEAARSGYLQSYDKTALLKIAKEHDLIIELDKQVGSFIVTGHEYGKVYSLDPLKEGAVKSIARHFVWDNHRTVEQDPAFGIRQLVDIAIKALSPSLNDTTNAVMCLHRLGAIFSELAGREVGQSVITDENGRGRLVVNEYSFSSLLTQSFDQIRFNSSQNLAMARTALKTLETIKSACCDKSDQEVVQEQIEIWKRQARACVTEPYDVENLECFLTQ